MKINCKHTNISLDYAKSNFKSGFIEQSSDLTEKALLDMQKTEVGEIMNPTENRMVGHYWLRNPELAPNADISADISNTQKRIKDFVYQVDQGNILGQTGKKIKHILLIGIGGSALGPQFIARALKYKANRNIFFFDNTDPEGFEDTLSEIPDLAATVVLVVTKSGSTTETFNGMLVAKHAFKKYGLEFNKAAIAITTPGSDLDKTAKSENWLNTFYLWDWVGGRTSLWSAVGLLPLELLGFNTEDFLRGAADMDMAGREKNALENPALLMSLFWLMQTKGKSEKNMIILPYSDRLELFGKYLQQLVMESLGKEHDLQGNIVNQGITVFGNKGSTDQHSYIQQLRGGPNDFFAVFIKPDNYSEEYDIVAKDGFTISQHLTGFYEGTKKALFDNQRESVSITIDKVNEYYLGVLVALFEKSVSMFASFVNINAYDQPGVEAGKQAAKEYLSSL